MICHFFIRKSKIHIFLLLSVAGKDSKIPRQVSKVVRSLKPAKMNFPGQKEHSPAFTARQHKVPRQVQ